MAFSLNILNAYSNDTRKERYMSRIRAIYIGICPRFKYAETYQTHRSASRPIYRNVVLAQRSGSSMGATSVTFSILTFKSSDSITGESQGRKNTRYFKLRILPTSSRVTNTLNSTAGLIRFKSLVTHCNGKRVGAIGRRNLRLKALG